MAKDHRATGQRPLGPVRPEIGRRSALRRSVPPAAGRRSAPPATGRRSSPTSTGRRFAPPAYVPPAAPPAPPAPGPPIFSIPLKHRDGCNRSSWRKTFTQECLAFFSRMKIEFFRTNGKFVSIWFGNEETAIIIDSDSYEAPSLAKIVEKPKDVDLVEPSEGDFVQILCQRGLDEEIRNKIFLAALSRGFKYVEY